MAPIRRGGGSTAGGRWFMTGPKIPKELGNSLYRFASLRGPPKMVVALLVSLKTTKQRVPDNIYVR